MMMMMMTMIYIDRTEQLFQVSNGNFFEGVLGSNPLHTSIHIKHAIISPAFFNEISPGFWEQVLGCIEPKTHTWKLKNGTSNEEIPFGNINSWWLPSQSVEVALYWTHKLGSYIEP